MTFKPLPCPDRWYGVLAGLGIVALDIGLLFAILSRPVDGLSFLLAQVLLISLPLLGWIGYRTVGLFTMEYWVDRDAVTLVWAGTRQIVPIGQIQRVLVTGPILADDSAEVWHWPCAHRRRLHCEELGTLNSYATGPMSEQIILVTPDESYGLTPSDREGFLAAVQERYALGAARALQSELRRPPLWTWPLWRDRIAFYLIGAGLLGVLVMFAALCFRFPGLSSDLPLHFDVNGLPDRIAPKQGLFALPIIGLVTWGLNLTAGTWLYRRVQRQSAYLLWGGAVVGQAISGLALFNLMRW